MNLFKNLPLFINRKLTIYIVLTAIMCGLAVGVWIKVGMTYKQSRDIKLQRENMIATVDKYNVLAAKINKEAYRPVEKTQINNVESNIMMMLQMNNLNLENFKPSLQQMNSKKEKNDGELYDLTFIGTWSNTVAALTNWHSKDALIGIKYLDIQPVDNIDIPQAVKTTIQYKIYTKDSSKKEDKNVSSKNSRQTKNT